MSWDIVIFNSDQDISDPSDIDESLLKPIDFGFILRKHFEEIIEDGDHREIKGHDFSIEYFEDNEPAGNRMFSLYGENALYALVQISIKNAWQIFDTGSGEMIDLAEPEKNGYKNFHAYLRQILNDAEG